MSPLWFPLVFGGGVAYLVLRGIRAFERRGSAPAEIELMATRMRELRETHWSMATTLDGLREEQEFADQLKAPPPTSAGSLEGP